MQGCGWQRGPRSSKKSLIGAVVRAAAWVPAGTKGPCSATWTAEVEADVQQRQAVMLGELRRRMEVSKRERGMAVHDPVQVEGGAAGLAMGKGKGR